MFLSACQKPLVKPKVDIEAEEAAVSNLVDSIITAIENQDADKMLSYFSDDVLVVGTDAGEFFNKQEITEIWKQVLEQPFDYEFVGESEIKVAPDGKSAFVLLEISRPEFPVEIQYRFDYHMVKENGKWLAYTLTTSWIVKDEALPTFFEAFKELPK
jgi:uncharacterized protein (TIGR02246 family)